LKRNATTACKGAHLKGTSRRPRAHHACCDGGKRVAARFLIAHTNDVDQLRYLKNNIKTAEGPATSRQRLCAIGAQTNPAAARAVLHRPQRAQAAKSPKLPQNAVMQLATERTTLRYAIAEQKHFETHSQKGAELGQVLREI
jgi:hypothetical protein